MTDPTTSVSLLDTELLLLDGACSDKVQTAVDLAKLRLGAADLYPGVSPAGVKVIVAAIEEAKASGILQWGRSQLSHCGICGTGMRYAVYKSGYRKGENNYSKPIHLSGIEMKRSFVVVRGHISIGACGSCMSDLLPHLKAALADIPVELPEILVADGAKRWVKDPQRHCLECDWTGGESEMGKLPAIMGGGYAGKCPSCGAENKAFCPDKIESTSSHAMIELVPPAPKPMPRPPRPPAIPGAAPTDDLDDLDDLDQW
jgi:hypothetical protein